MRHRLGPSPLLPPSLPSSKLTLAPSPPQDRAALSSDPEFAGLDLSPLEPSPAPEHWAGARSWTSKEGIFAPERVEERARWVRRWLRERSEDKIVVVAHGDILRCLTEGRRSASVRPAPLLRRADLGPLPRAALTLSFSLVHSLFRSHLLSPSLSTSLLYRSSRSQPWANAEVRAYTFSTDPAHADDAVVVPLREVAKEGDDEPTTTDMANGRA